MNSIFKFKSPVKTVKNDVSPYINIGKRWNIYQPGIEMKFRIQFEMELGRCENEMVLLKPFSS